MSDEMTKVAYLAAELERARKEAGELLLENHRLVAKVNDRAALDAAWVEHMKAIQAGMERQTVAQERMAQYLLFWARQNGSVF